MRKAFGLLLILLGFTQAAFAQAPAQGQEYALGAGDVVRITVFQNPDLTTETRVSESGAITYPLIGSVPVGGLSIGAAEKKIATMLREGGFVLQPQVNMLVLQIRGNQVAVLGQVNRPGRFPLETSNNKLSDMLAHGRRHHLSRRRHRHPRWRARGQARAHGDRHPRHVPERRRRAGRRHPSAATPSMYIALRCSTSMAKCSAPAPTASSAT